MRAEDPLEDLIQCSTTGFWVEDISLTDFWRWVGGVGAERDEALKILGISDIERDWKRQGKAYLEALEIIKNEMGKRGK